MRTRYLVAALLLVAGIVTTTAQLDENGLPLWWDGGAQPAVDDNGHITIYGISPSGHTVPNETIEMYQIGHYDDGPIFDTNTGSWMYYNNPWDHSEISHEPFVSMPATTNQ